MLVFAVILASDYNSTQQHTDTYRGHNHIAPIIARIAQFALADSEVAALAVDLAVVVGDVGVVSRPENVYLLCEVCGQG